MVNIIYSMYTISIENNSIGLKNSPFKKICIFALKQRLMRLYLLIFMILGAGVTSCDSGNTIVPAETETTDSLVVEDFERFEDWDTLQGNYIADFGDSKIRINIDYINPFKVIGYNIHKGLQRNLSGEVSEDAQFIHILLNEPGDHEYDGVFDLFYEKETGDLTGSWEPNSPKLKSKDLQLRKLDMENETVDWNGNDILTIQSFIGVFNGAYDVSGNGKYIYFENGGRVFIEYYESLDSLNRSEQMERIFGAWYVDDKKVFVEFSKNDLVGKGLHKATISKSEEEGYYPPMLTFDNMSFMPEYY